MGVEHGEVSRVEPRWRSLRSLSRERSGKRAAKTVIGTREKRIQSEPVVEGDAVVVAAEAGTGCDGMAGEKNGAGLPGGSRRPEKGERGKC